MINFPDVVSRQPQFGAERFIARRIPMLMKLHKRRGILWLLIHGGDVASEEGLRVKHISFFARLPYLNTNVVIINMNLN